MHCKESQYRVILHRPMQGDMSGGGDVSFAPGKFVPVAFLLWDGDNGEDGLKMSLSTWHSIVPQPPMPLSAYL